MLAMSDDRPASVADIVVEELRKKEINGPIRLPKRDFFTRGQKLKVKDPWHILSGYDLEFAGMSTRERVRVMLEWFGRRQTIALPINSVVGCLIATILLMILSENNVRTLTLCLAELLVLEVVYVHPLGIAFRAIIGSAILEVADQFLLLAVDADDRQSQFREDVDPLLDVDELPVPIRVVWPGEPLHVDPR